MTRALRRSRRMGATGAFTLVEIVLVVAILATLAGLVISSLQGAEGQASTDIARRELSEIRRAVLQFRADTGFLPKRGPFNLHPADVGTDFTRAEDGGRVRLANLPVPSELPVSSELDNIVKRAWFDAPANLWQLFLCPFPTDPSHPDFHPLAVWDPGRKRGWRGPYVTRGIDGWVAVTSGLATDGTGAWPSTGVFLPFFPAVADPFVRASDVRPAGGVGFLWRPWHEAEVMQTPFGRPFLLLDLDPGSPGPQGDRREASTGERFDLVAERARVVSLGPDGQYDPVPINIDTRLGPCVANDDLGLFLFR